MDPFLQAAIDEARLGLAEGGIPIGSVIVHRGRIIGRGHNRRVQQGSVIRHGEIVEEGDVEQVFHAPRHPYTKELIASQLDDRPARGALSSTTGGAR